MVCPKLFGSSEAPTTTSRRRARNERAAGGIDHVAAGHDTITPASGGAQVEHQPGGHLSVKHGSERIVDVAEVPALVDHFRTPGGLQREHLGQVEAGADDRADHRDAVEHGLEDGQ